MSKAISPVVAMALLLVVTVSAAVGFQSWFNSYSSSIQSDIEENTGDNLRIQGLFGDKLYLFSEKKITLTSLSVRDTSGTQICSFSNTTHSLSTLNSDPDLVLWWKFNESDGNTVQDYSGNGREGTLLNSRDVEIRAIDGDNDVLEVRIRTVVDGEYSGNFEGCTINQSGTLQNITTDLKIDHRDRNWSVSDTSGFAVANAYLHCASGPYWVDTRFGRSLYFDGLTSFMNATYPLILGDNFTIVASLGEIDGSNFFQSHTSGQAWNFIYGNLGLKLNSSGSWTQVINNPPHYGYHQTVMRRNDSEIRRYLDSYNDITLDIADSTWDTMDLQYIARRTTPGVGTHHTGIAQEVRVYNRSLSEDEITTLYWHFFQFNDEDLNIIDLSSCGLVRGETYEIVGFSDDARVESRVVKK